MSIRYSPSTVGLDLGLYDLSLRDSLRDDVVASATIDDLAELARSPHWEDRIRAEHLRDRTTITLPDQFPCIFETPDSPNRADLKYQFPFARVVSPDMDMLVELLPDYQELWDSHTSQWGPGSRRIMAVGRLDGLSPRGVYRPGTAPSQVIGHTMQVHNMYRRAPERLKEMHPQHEQWNRKVTA